MKHIIKFFELLTTGQKFLWIPDKKLSSSTHSTAVLQWGKLAPLSCLVLNIPKDGPITLHIDGPIKYIYDYYEVDKMGLLLSRSMRKIERVCYACQAVGTVHMYICVYC
jgi:hypothetical protein